MTRIFLGLAALHAAALILASALGWLIDGPRSAWLDVHWHVGFWTSILTLLVHSIVLTYLVGTGRWVREVAAVYRLADVWLRQSWRTKVRAIPFIVSSMLLAIATAALGAAVDPGATVRFDSWMGVPAAAIHHSSALALMLFSAVSYYFEYTALRENAATIANVMQQVQHLREDTAAPTPAIEPAVNTRGPNEEPPPLLKQMLTNQHSLTHPKGPNHEH